MCVVLNARIQEGSKAVKGYPKQATEKGKGLEEKGMSSSGEHLTYSTWRA